MDLSEIWHPASGARLKPRDPCDHVRTQHPDHDGEHHRRCHCTDRISSDLIKETRLAGMAFCMQRRGTQEDNQ